MSQHVSMSGLAANLVECAIHTNASIRLASVSLVSGHGFQDVVMTTWLVLNDDMVNPVHEQKQSDNWMVAQFFVVVVVFFYG